MSVYNPVITDDANKLFVFPPYATMTVYKVSIAQGQDENTQDWEKDVTAWMAANGVMVIARNRAWSHFHEVKRLARNGCVANRPDLSLQSFGFIDADLAMRFKLTFA